MRDEPLDLTVTDPKKKSEEYLEGFEAYCWGVSASDNPYDPSAESFQDWYRGWYEAAEEHQTDELNVKKRGDEMIISGVSAVGMIAEFAMANEGVEMHMEDGKIRLSGLSELQAENLRRGLMEQVR